MTTTVFLGILLGAVLLALLWLLGGPRNADSMADDSDTAVAEEEVRDVDAFRSPEDAEEELPDWGPGAPKT